ASENWQRIREAGFEDRVFPLQAEAHAFPFAEGFFDALVSLDAYHYFGTDDNYLGYGSRFVKEGGQIGIVSPGLTREFTGDVPEHLTAWWSPELWTLHSADWWHRHWVKTGLVDVTHSFSPDSGRLAALADVARGLPGLSLSLV